MHFAMEADARHPGDLRYWGSGDDELAGPGLADRQMVRLLGGGVRLLAAGIKQALQPSITARTIFHMESPGERKECPVDGGTSRVANVNNSGQRWS